MLEFYNRHTWMETMLALAAIANVGRRRYANDAARIVPGRSRARPKKKPASR